MVVALWLWQGMSLRLRNGFLVFLFLRCTFGGMAMNVPYLQMAWHTESVCRARNGAVDE